MYERLRHGLPLDAIGTSGPELFVSLDSNSSGGFKGTKGYQHGLHNTVSGSETLGH